MRVVIVGAGYVGLTTGACLAQLGHAVTCIDIDKTRIDSLRRGSVPIYEPGLSELVERGVEAGRLHFTDQLGVPAARAEIVMLAVGTPSLANGAIDLSHVENAALQAAAAVGREAAIVIKSTVVPGTALKLRSLLSSATGRSVSVASNPEFLREGSAISDFCSPDRIVVGADDSNARNLLEQLYRPLVERGVALISTDTVSAELTKYAANAFLALKIGFINEIADLCAAVGGDVTTVAEGVGLDRRIGSSFLAPGPGFGGSCFPKDTRALATVGRAVDARQELVECLIAANDRRKRRVAEDILRRLGRHPEQTTVAILGSAFKANTDDVRESAALTVVPLLIERGVNVRMHDPQPPAEGPREFGGVVWCKTPYAAARGAELIVILTEWDAYRRLNLRRLASQCDRRTILDYRNVLAPDEAAAAGFDYISTGRAPVTVRKAAWAQASRGGLVAASPG